MRLSSRSAVGALVGALCACGAVGETQPDATPGPPSAEAGGGADADGGGADGPARAGGRCDGFRICESFDDPSRVGQKGAGLVVPPWTNFTRSGMGLDPELVTYGSGGGLRTRVDPGPALGESTLEATIDLDGTFEMIAAFEIPQGRGEVPTLFGVRCKVGAAFASTFVEVGDAEIHAVVGQDGPKAVVTRSGFAGFGGRIVARLFGSNGKLGLEVNGTVVGEAAVQLAESPWLGACVVWLGVSFNHPAKKAVDVTFDEVRVK